MQFKSRPDIFAKLDDLRNQLFELSVHIKLVNITGHYGMKGNEMAAEYARNVAKQLNRY